MIRHARPDDASHLAAMGQRFFAYSPFAGLVEFEPDAVEQRLLAMMADEGSSVIVAELDGVVVGAIVGMLSPAWFNPQSLMAVELAWWVDEAHRHGAVGLKLFFAFEAWGRAMGAAMVVASDLVVNGDTPVGRIVDRLGFAMVERSHVKGLN